MVQKGSVESEAMLLMQREERVPRLQRPRNNLWQPESAVSDSVEEGSTQVGPVDSLALGSRQPAGSDSPSLLQTESTSLAACQRRGRLQQDRRLRERQWD